MRLIASALSRTAAGLLLAAAACASQAAGDPEAGLVKSNICQGCHNLDGFRTVFPEVYHIPRIQGQSAEYIIYALNEYKSGTRFAEHAAPLDPLMAMTAIADSLSDEDIADLAAYYSSLGQ